MATTLKNATWPEPKERDKVKAWMKEIGERVKKRMLGVCLRGREMRVMHLFGNPLAHVMCARHPQRFSLESCECRVAPPQRASVPIADAVIFD